MKRMPSKRISLVAGSILLVLPIRYASTTTADQPVPEPVAIAEPVISAELGAAGEPLPSLATRFADDDGTEAPDFQKHIVPLLGRLGCNGRACHGSFQGQGGFQLSLFGYDFKADHAALLGEQSGRVDLDDVDESLVLVKPVDAELHEGGKRMDVDSWQYRVLRRWIEEGGKWQSGRPQELSRLEVTPQELRFDRSGQSAQLTAVAHWSDGTVEDVTDLCRFSTNDEAIAGIDEQGRLESGDPGDTHVVVFYDNAVVPVPVLQPVRVDVPVPSLDVVSNHPVDQLIQVKLDKLNIVPAEKCDDADFVRRIHLDLTGSLPTAPRVKAFFEDERDDKRERLIDELLTTPEYAAWWATRFSDWTGNNEAQLNNVFPIRNAASKLWYAWLEKRIAENVPYDEIVAGIVTANSRMPEETYLEYCEAMSKACQPGGEELFAERDGLPQFWSRQNFRQPEERAIGFAYTFLGIRIQCAQCHKHPFDQWSKDDFDQFAKLFTPVQANNNAVSPDSRKDREELLEQLTGGKELRGGDLRRAITKELESGITVPFPELFVRTAAPGRVAGRRPGMPAARRAPPAAQGRILGVQDPVALDSDPRQRLMEWLRDPNNPYFAKAIVNRVWANYFGIGIVNPTDDLNLANPPSNALLFDYLAAGFVESNYDLHWLHRTITSSDAYQRSWRTNPTNRLDKTNFSHHIPRRLPAEVIHDAILFATAGDSKLETLQSSMKNRAIALPSPAYRGNNQSSFALSVFGQSIRETQCDCDRSDEPNLLQSIYLLNDTDVHSWLTAKDGWVTEIGRQHGLVENGSRTAAADQAGQRQAAGFLRTLEKRVAQFTSLPEAQQERQRARMKRELNQARRRLATMSIELPAELDLFAESPEIARTAEVAKEETQRLERATLVTIVSDAYLRALSREPSQSEMATSIAHIDDSETPGQGIEGLLWALINTKEFILTH